MSDGLDERLGALHDMWARAAEGSEADEHSAMLAEAELHGDDVVPCGCSREGCRRCLDTGYVLASDERAWREHDGAREAAE